MKESRGHFIPDLPDFDKNQVGASRGTKSGQCDWGIILIDLKGYVNFVIQMKLVMNFTTYLIVSFSVMKGQNFYLQKYVKIEMLLVLPTYLVVRIDTFSLVWPNFVK